MKYKIFYFCIFQIFVHAINKNLLYISVLLNKLLQMLFHKNIKILIQPFNSVFCRSKKFHTIFSTLFKSFFYVELYFYSFGIQKIIRFLSLSSINKIKKVVSGNYTNIAYFDKNEQ